MNSLRSLVLTFPDLPDMAVSANAKSGYGHWKQRHTAVKPDRWRWKVLVLSWAGAWRPWVAQCPPPYIIAWEVHYPDRRKVDADGVLSALKHAQDALVDAGLIPEDSVKTLPEVRLRVILGAKEPGTTLTLTPLRECSHPCEFLEKPPPAGRDQVPTGSDRKGGGEGEE